MELQSIWPTNEPPGHSFIICPCERSIVITLCSRPSWSHLPRPSSGHPFSPLPARSFIPFLCLHHFWGIIRNTWAESRCDRAQDYANTCENLPVLSDTDVDTLQMCARTHAHVCTHTQTHTSTQLLQILLTGYAAETCSASSDSPSLQCPLTIWIRKPAAHRWSCDCQHVFARPGDHRSQTEPAKITPAHVYLRCSQKETNASEPDNEKVPIVIQIIFKKICTVTWHITASNISWFV